MSLTGFVRGATRRTQPNISCAICCTKRHVKCYRKDFVPDPTEQPFANTYGLESPQDWEYKG